MLASPDTIILIPSFQPSEVLISLAKQIKEKGYDILLVDDGSGDAYSSIFADASSYGKVVGYSKNKGKGEALKFGFNYIKNNYKDALYVLTVDGDGQHTISDIVEMVKLVKEKNKIIIGERLFDGKIPLKSKIGNNLSKFSQGLCTYRYMKDNQCGLRAFPIRYIDELINIKGSRYEYEMMVLNYIQMKEIPYTSMDVMTIYENNNQGSHFRPLQDTLLIQGSIFSYGLINLLSFLFGLLSAFLFYELLFKEGAVCSNPLSYELATLIASPLTLLFQFILTLIVFRPTRVARVIFRFIIIKIIMLISEILVVSFFVRIAGFAFPCAYLICLPLVLLPLYYLIKGMSLVYSASE